MGNRDEISNMLSDLSKIRSEIKEVKSTIKSSKIDFQRSFLKIFPPGTKLSNHSESQDRRHASHSGPENSAQILEVDSENKTSKKTDDKIIKKIYRKIALKTHPDKNTDKEDFEKINLMKKYQDATEMYKKSRLVEILEIAHDLHIDIGELPLGKIKNLKNELSDRKNILDNLKLDFFYIWSQSDFEKRCSTIFKIARDLNIEVEEEKIRLVLRKTGLERSTGAHPGSHMKRIKNIPM